MSPLAHPKGKTPSRSCNLRKGVFLRLAACQSLSLWERWHCEAMTERASPARKSRRRSDRQALCQSDTIAAPVILGQQPCPLSRACARQGRVAAPSVCFAAARILLAAAPTAPPCFRHWRRSSPLPPKGEPLTERLFPNLFREFVENARQKREEFVKVIKMPRRY